MLFRFSLYGFLKNQRYYEPFFLLFVLSFLEEADNRFFLVGLLIAFREVSVNILEIPSGAIADGFGRRRAMIFSLLAYCAAFVLFGSARSYAQLYLPMLFFALGEAFRTGTHKAIIFDWLQRQGRLGERTSFYGCTRSWAKIGAAVSVIPAVILVFSTQNYRWVFWFCIPIYLLNLINLYSYPHELDSVNKQTPSCRYAWQVLTDALRRICHDTKLRGLVIESMLQEGIFKSVKDYVQPLVKTAALGLPLFVALADRQRTAVLMAPVFILIYVLESVASRKAHMLTAWKNGENSATEFLWKVILIIYICLGAGLVAIAQARLAMYPAWETIAVVAALLAYLALYAAQNLWSPNQISRFNQCSDNANFATVLSIESQARAFTAMIFAPLIGWLIDISDTNLWPVAVTGMLTALAGLLWHRRVFSRSNPL